MPLSPAQKFCDEFCWARDRQKMASMKNDALTFCFVSAVGWAGPSIKCLASERICSASIDSPANFSPTLPPCVVFTLFWMYVQIEVWKWRQAENEYARKLEDLRKSHHYKSSEKKCLHHSAWWCVLFQVAWYWIFIVPWLFWNKLHPLHKSHIVIGPRGWSVFPQD